MKIDKVLETVMIMNLKMFLNMNLMELELDNDLMRKLLKWQKKLHNELDNKMILLLILKLELR